MPRLKSLVSLARSYYEEFTEALKDYERGEERIYAVERLAQLIAQTVLDYAAMLAARERGAKPETYRALIRWLAERLGASEEEKRFLEGLAGFRNILVHMYAELDRDLELEAFREINSMMPRILEMLERYSSSDPCREEVAQALRRIAGELGIRYVILFGSLARKECGNDVDLAVELREHPRSMLEIGKLRAMLEDELKTRVDLVVLNLPVPAHLAKAIVDDGIVLYGDSRRAEETLLRLYKEYLDNVEQEKKLVRTEENKNKYKL
ncbi:MAG: DUF86 domain-containing protein [Desulfurococcales archaeon]|nr:DUF86 domain-containing protein [Desulfurococcales archaeon]